MTVLAPPLSSRSASSSFVRNRPPGPRGLRIACLCRDSCRYGFLDVLSLWTSASRAHALRRFKIRWYCFALTKSGSVSSRLGSSRLAALWLEAVEEADEAVAVVVGVCSGGAC